MKFVKGMVIFAIGAFIGSGFGTVKTTMSYCRILSRASNNDKNSFDLLAKSMDLGNRLEERKNGTN